MDFVADSVYGRVTYRVIPTGATVVLTWVAPYRGVTPAGDCLVVRTGEATGMRWVSSSYVACNRSSYKKSPGNRSYGGIDPLVGVGAVYGWFLTQAGDIKKKKEGMNGGQSIFLRCSRWW